MKTPIQLMFWLSPIVGLAQAEKGTFLAGGSVSASRTKAEFYAAYFDPFTGYVAQGTFHMTTRSASVSPTLGFFPLKSLAVGITVPFSVSSTTSPSPFAGTEAYSKNTSIGLGPFVRYFLPVSDKLFGLAHVGYQVGFGSQEYNRFVFDGATEAVIIERDRMQSGTFEGGAGISWFLNQSVSLDILVSYTKYSSTLNDAPSNDNAKIGIAGGLQFYWAR